MPAQVIDSDPRNEYWFDEGCYILEVCNRPDDPLVSIARARVGAGTATRWHQLDGVWERYVILRGEGVAEVGDLPPAPVKEGTVVMIPPGTRQRIRNTGSEDLVFYAICSPRFTRACYQAMED